MTWKHESSGIFVIRAVKMRIDDVTAADLVHADGCEFAAIIIPKCLILRPVRVLNMENRRETE